MYKRKAFSLAAVGTLVLAGVAGAYEAGATTAPTPPADALWRPTTHPGRFDAGDLLEIDVADLAGAGAISQMPVRVQDDGTIPVAYLGTVPAGGRTAGELVAQLQDRFQKMAVLNNSNVTVRRLQVAGTPGSVSPGSIGDYDLVRLVVNGLDAGKGEPPPVIRRVDGDGKLTAPLVGGVKVAGLTDAQAVAAIAAAYRAAHILDEAQVSVLTLERAPADAGHKSLPDGPIDPVPEVLRPLYGPR